MTRSPDALMNRSPDPIDSVSTLHVSFIFAVLALGIRVKIKCYKGGQGLLVMTLNRRKGDCALALFVFLDGLGLGVSRSKIRKCCSRNSRAGRRLRSAGGQGNPEFCSIPTQHTSYFASTFGRCYGLG